MLRSIPQFLIENFQNDTPLSTVVVAKEQKPWYNLSEQVVAVVHICILTQMRTEINLCSQRCGMANEKCKKKYGGVQMDGFSSIRLRRLIDERKSKTGKTLRDFAADMGISFTVLSEWQRGTKAPRADSLRILAQYFEVSADYLLELSDVQSINADVRKMSEYTGLSEEALDVLHQLKECLNETPEIDRFQKKRLEDTLSIMGDIISSGTFGVIADALVKVRYCAESERKDDIRADKWVEKRHTQEFYEWYKSLLDEASDGFYQRHFKDFEQFKKWVDSRTELQIKNDFNGKISELQQFETVSNSEAHAYRAQRFIQRYAEELMVDGQQAAESKGR